MTNKRILSTLLALAILLSCVGWTPVQAQGTAPIDAETPANQTSISTLPIEEEEGEIPEREPIARLYDEEGDDLNKIVYLNSDGTRTMHLYDYPVKYRDASGEIHDISLEIADGTTELNRFQSSANSIMTAFPSKASDGISLSGEGVSIKLIPNIPEADTNTIHMTGNAKRIDSKTISYDYDAKTTIEYSLTYTGFKEDIVVSEYTGQTEYEFLLQTNGLALTQIDGSFYLTDEGGKIKAAIGDVIVFTADEKNNTMGTMEAETLKENHSYLLTIVLDAQYLADPNTAYPIRIDPTIDINYDANGSGAIEDVTIYSNVTPDGASTSLFVGLRETRGISRILMRFPNLDLSGLTGATVVSAEVTLRDLICEGTYLPVYCYPFMGANWTESTASWSMTQDWGPELDNQVISYSNGVNLNPRHRYTFNITAAVQGWINGTYSKAKGLIFKTSNEVETAATYEQRQFASYNRTNYRPTFTMTYTLPGVLNYTSKDVDEGSSFTLSARLNGTVLSGVNWNSSNDSIATVSSSGVVTGIKAGQTTITATHGDLTKPVSCVVWVTKPDGVYYIKNNYSSLYLSVPGSAVTSGTDTAQQAKRTSDPERLSQLWKITYLGEGYYSIRPMHKLNMGLKYSNGAIDVYEIGTSDTSVDSVLFSARWRIFFNTNGYVFQNAGYESRTMVPTHSSSMVDTPIIGNTYASANVAYRWTLERVTSLNNQILLYDTRTSSYVTTTTNTVRYIAPDEELILSALGMSASFVSMTTNVQNIAWESSNPDAVAIDSATGEITGILPGTSATITVRSSNGSNLSKSYTVYVTAVPEGEYFICNKSLGNYVQIDDDASSTATSGAILELLDFDGADDQKWVFTRLDDGYYSIISTASQLALTVQADYLNTANKAIVQTAYTGLDSQKWRINVASSGAYIIRPKSGESYATDWCMSAGSSLGGSNGRDVEQRAYTSDSDYKDEWYIHSPISIGLSTDDYDSGECGNGHRNSYLYANTFYDTLTLAKSKTHKYNCGSTHDASPNDFAEIGAISTDIDFMIYIGHGHAAHDDKGNHLHYDCGIWDKPHVKVGDVYTYCDAVGNKYTDDMRFGSEESNLRWVFLYTCNFLTTGEYVTDDDLRTMMTGAHIVMGYGSQSYLCNPMVRKFAEYLSEGESIIQAFFMAGDEGEATDTDDNHIQKVLYIPQAANETIYSTPVHYSYNSSDVLIAINYIQDSYR